MTLVASHFLAGSILSWGMPIGLVVAVCIYWGMLLRRRAAGARSGKAE